MNAHIFVGDCQEVLRLLPAGHFHTCVTSPPYFGLRDYGVDGQMGLEPTPDEYVAELVEVFRAVRRVLRDDGIVRWQASAKFGVDRAQSGIRRDGAEADRQGLTDLFALFP